MWSLLGTRFRITLVLVVAGIWSASLHWFGVFQDVETALVPRIIAFTSPVGLLVILGLLGHLNVTWSLPCKFGLGFWFPDLNGRWSGTYVSTYQSDKSNGKLVLTLRITQSWTKVEVVIDAMSSPARSITLACKPDRYHGQPCLYVFFEGTTSIKSSTDADTYLGAELIIYHKHSDTISGQYMTNRNWKLGEHSAGRFELSRLAV